MIIPVTIATDGVRKEVCVQMPNGCAVWMSESDLDRARTIKVLEAKHHEKRQLIKDRREDLLRD